VFNNSHISAIFECTVSDGKLLARRCNEISYLGLRDGGVGLDDRRVCPDYVVVGTLEESERLQTAKLQSSYVQS
jgi:hypothetical protein